MSRGAQQRPPAFGPKRKYRIQRIDPRYLRSDGTPNISNRIYQREDIVYSVARRPVTTVSDTTPVRDLIKMIYETKKRRYPVVDGEGRLIGIVTATDVVNYLGGGDYYNIALNRYKDSMYRVFDAEVSNIMTRDVVYAMYDEPLYKVVERMVHTGYGMLPILTPEMKVYGVITERDVLEMYREFIFGRPVEEVMRTNVETIRSDATLKEAMFKMIELGFRRLPVVDKDGRLVGLMTVHEVIKFYATNEAWKYAKNALLGETHTVPVEKVMKRDVATISPKAMIHDAYSLMKERGVDSLVVVEDGKIVGMLTERDLLHAISLEEIKPKGR